MSDFDKDISNNKVADLHEALKTRHLQIGTSPRLMAIIKIRATALKSIRHFFESDGWTEVTVPTIATLTGSCEDPSTLFSLPYFGHDAFLIQTGQLHLEPIIYGIPKVYTITHSYRAEHRVTERHLTEFVLVEAEAANYTLDQIIDVQERLITQASKDVLQANRLELDLLGADTGKLDSIGTPFERVTYSQATKILGVEDEWGRDLKTVEENKLTDHFNSPIFVTNYPKEIKFFNMREDPGVRRKGQIKNHQTVLSSDLLLPGHGEVAGASEREPDPVKLKHSLVKWAEAFDLNVQDYEWYLDLCNTRYLPHSGFGLGFERLVRWICDLETILEAVEYPRDSKHIAP